MNREERAEKEFKEAILSNCVKLYKDNFKSIPVSFIEKHLKLSLKNQKGRNEIRKSLLTFQSKYEKTSYFYNIIQTTLELMILIYELKRGK